MNPLKLTNDGKDVTAAIGFGAEAVRYALRFGKDTQLIAAGLDGCVAALVAAVEWRKAGKEFYVAPLIDDPRALVAQRLGGRWIERLTNIDDRYQAFDALGADHLGDAGIAVSQDDLTVIEEPARRVLRDVAIMSDTLMVRSQREAERVSRVLKRYRPTTVIAPGEDSVPSVAPIRGNTVVVWAPYLPADRLGVIAMALEYMHCPVTYVCAAGQLANVRGAFVTPAAGAAALETAACIIDASIADPGSAIALARLGVPLLATTTSGATEFLDRVLPYDPWDWRSIFANVAAARGFRPPLRKITNVSPPDLPATPPAREIQTSGPTVSVVVLTYNRRELLPLTLDSIARQRYQNIELVVVNNGGVDVSDIVARYANGRLLTLPENILPNAAVERGFEASTGRFFSVISDDDEFFPDHFARLVEALERSGAAIAHTNTVTRYFSVVQGERQTVAYRVRADRPSDRLQILVGSTMSIFSMLFHQDVRAAIGRFRIELGPADLEYQMRAAQRFDFVHVDSVTCEWNYAIEGSSYTHQDNMAEGLKVIYSDYPSDSAIVQKRRRNEIARFDTRNAGIPLWPPDLLLSDRKDSVGQPR